MKNKLLDKIEGKMIIFQCFFSVAPFDLLAIFHIYYNAETYGSAYCLSLQKNTCRSLWADVTCTVVHTFTHPNESHVTPVLILIIVDGVQHDAVAVFVVVDVDKAA